jgi:Ca2+-transporting ATPase
MANFHTENIASILNKFNSNMDQGLSADTLQRAEAQYGKNELDPAEKAFSLKAFLEPFLTWRILVLTLATLILIISYVNGASGITLYTIGAVGIVLVMHIGWAYLTDYRSRSRDDSIRQLMVHSIKVIRQGKIDKCPPRDIVPGDLLSFSAGDYVPADARIIESEGLMIDESALFGTEEPVPKTSTDISDRSVPPQRQKNMAFAGTYVAAGHGYAIVVQTGKSLEIWKQRRDVRPPTILNTLAENETQSLHTVMKVAGVAIAGVTVGVAWWFEYQNQATDWYALTHLGILFILASAPHDVISLLRLSFSQHAQKLLEKGVILRNSRSLEKLSRITAFCANENGLSTTRALTISNLFVDEQLIDGNTWQTWLDSLQDLTPTERQETIASMPSGGKIPQGASHLVFTAALGTSGGEQMDNSESFNTEENWEIEQLDGAPSLQAVIQKAIKKLGYEPETLKAKLPLVNSYPSVRNYGYQMQVFESAPENYLNVIFGEGQTVLDTCAYALIDGEIEPMLDNRYERYCEVIDYLLTTRSQIYGVAFHSSDVILKPQEMEDNAIFLGFIALSVSNGEQTKAVLKSSLDTGLKVILMAEDEKQQTIDFAKDLGLIHNRKSVVSSEELDEVQREQFDVQTSKWLAYSQPTSEQRRNIVLSLKRQGHAVGFLGENKVDLRAMNVTDITLADSTKAPHAVQAVADGLIDKKGFQAVRDGLLYAREAYHNIAGFLRWSFSCTLSLLLTLTFGTVLHYLYKLPMPLTLTQVIWVQFLLTLLPSLGVGTEKIFADEKHHRPTLFSASRFLSKTTPVDIICRSVTISLMTIIPFFFLFWNSSALSDPLGVSTLLKDVFSTSNSTDQNATDISVARTVACTTLIFTQLTTCWQTLRYPWESLFQRMFANIRLFIILFIVIGLHLIAVYVEPIRQFLGMAHLKWEWQWALLFSLTLFFLPLNLAINARPDDDY